ncbi:MAG: hypothetical protein LBF22_05230 [Deltaproteobacteria bacterium]|jgi:chemotaxis methyl-accepting protein methylase|nr:hypothetical protein [Deltaproteobacteria bacterium]
MTFELATLPALPENVKDFFEIRGRAGTPFVLDLLNSAVQLRRNRLKLSEEEYAQKIPLPLQEGLEIWKLGLPNLPYGFFKYPQTFKVLGELLREWSVLASTKTLQALVLNCGPGMESVSVAIGLSQSALWEKGWQITVTAMDIFPTGLEVAKKGNFSLKDIQTIPKPTLKKYFVRKGLFYHLKNKMIPPIKYLLGDPFSQSEKDSLEPCYGTFDLVFARDFSLFFSDFQADLLLQVIHSLLKPGGLAITSPFELFSPQNSLSLEECLGVCYYRKHRLKIQSKSLPFHPKRALKSLAQMDMPITVGFPPSQYSKELKMIQKIVAEDPLTAKELVIGTLLRAQLENQVCWDAYSLLSAIEAILGRPNYANSILSAVGLLQNPKAS